MADQKDFEEISKSDIISGPFSDFFLDTFPVLFPEAYKQELYNFFRYVAHPYRRCWDSPTKSPKNEEIESAIRNKGQKGSHTFHRNDWKFILRPFGAWMFDQKFEGRKHYYTSDKRLAMPYLDVDCHRAYQSPAMGREARKLIEEEFQARVGVMPSFVLSDGGENGYLKVDIGRTHPEAVNRVFDELQAAIRLLLAKHGNLADFEIKGTITWMDKDGSLKAGRYGKLPMCSPDWSYRWFESFRQVRRVTLGELERMIAGIRAEVTDVDERRHEEAKHQAVLDHYLPVGDKQKWKLNAEFGAWWVDDQLWSYRGREWIARKLLKETLVERLWPEAEAPDDVESLPECPDSVPSDLDLIDGPKADAEEMTQPDSQSLAAKRSRNVGRLADEPDSFQRQREALLLYARLLKRVPTVDEALDYIKHNSLFTPPWSDNLAGRKARVTGILKYIARTFDAGKCKQRTVDAAKLGSWAMANAGKFDSWAVKKFPNGIFSGKKCVDQYGEIFEPRLPVSAQFVGVFVALCEFALLVDKNDDSTLPHERAKETWKALHKKRLVSVPFCDRKWAVCRDEMEKFGIVLVTNRKYCAGKAMEWDVGQFFPGLGLWKTKKKPSLLDPVSLADLVGKMRSTTREVHNTLLSQQSVKRPQLSHSSLIRPPPTITSR